MIEIRPGNLGWNLPARPSHPSPAHKFVFGLLNILFTSWNGQRLINFWVCGARKLTDNSLIFLKEISSLLLLLLWLHCPVKNLDFPSLPLSKLIKECEQLFEIQGNATLKLSPSQWKSEKKCFSMQFWISRKILVEWSKKKWVDPAQFASSPPWFRLGPNPTCPKGSEKPALPAKPTHFPGLGIGCSQTGWPIIWTGPIMSVYIFEPDQTGEQAKTGPVWTVQFRLVQSVRTFTMSLFFYFFWLAGLF